MIFMYLSYPMCIAAFFGIISIAKMDLEAICRLYGRWNLTNECFLVWGEWAPPSKLICV